MSPLFVVLLSGLLTGWCFVVALLIGWCLTTLVRHIGTAGALVFDEQIEEVDPCS